MIISSSSHLLLLTEDAANGLIEAAVEVNIENERFTVVLGTKLTFLARSRLAPKFSNVVAEAKTLGAIKKKDS